MDLKADVWEQVMEFATLLVNEDQPKKYWMHYNALKDYCEAESLAGYDHPFLWESLADFTKDDNASIPLYRRALSLAFGDDARPYRVSIRFALAERYRSKGEEALAREYAMAADAEVDQIDDAELKREIGQFLCS